MRWLIFAVTLVAFSEVNETPANACGIPTDVLRAVAQPTDPALVQKLRDRGERALNDLFLLRGLIEMQAAEEAKLPQPSPEKLASFANRIAIINALIDQVGKQRYCSLSRLYWHTDFEQAKAAAQSSQKPILSLRMLGNLDEDFSCANSRFFRTTLYANEQISAALRDNYILHWQSVRPVPKVTIDFGDGRKLERTLTGNSIHYILTPDGEVVEALPGLYGPKAFLAKVSEGASLARQIAALHGQERRAALVAYHTERFNRLGEEWNRDMQEIARVTGIGNLKNVALAASAPLNVSATQAANPPAANVAVKIAVPKMRVERELIAAALPTAATPEGLEDERTWNAVAALHAEDSRLDDTSRELIRSQNPNAAIAGRLAITKRVVEDPLVRLVRSLETSIALDTVRNEYRLHRQIHGWYRVGSYNPPIDVLNERVYAELFLTPSSDPWLGLAPADVYTALPNSGVVQVSP